MRTTVNEPVKVRLDLDSNKSIVAIHRILWHGQDYSVKELGIRYRIRDGRKQIHVFTVNVGALDMCLHIDGDSLRAILTEVSDGLPD